MRPGLGGSLTSEDFREKARKEDPLTFIIEKLSECSYNDMIKLWKKAKKKAFDRNYEIIDDWWYQRYAYLSRLKRKIDDLQAEKSIFIVNCSSCNQYIQQKNSRLVTPVDFVTKCASCK